MNELQIFENAEFGKIRTVEVDGEIYFFATDIAKALGYSNPHDAILKHCRWVAKREVPHPQSKTKIMEVNVIPEGDLYRLIGHSELPNAQKFESWVFDEVLPSIRKTGQYSTNRFEIPLKEQVESLEVVASMLRMNDVSKLVMLENFYGSYNIPTDFLPKYVKAERLTSSLSSLLEKNGCEMKAVAFNKMLVEQGYLEERERASSRCGVKKFKSVTEKGLKYGQNQVNPKNPKETQPLWYEDSFMELYCTVQGK